MTAGLRTTIAVLTLGAAALLVAAYFRVAADPGTVVTSAGPQWAGVRADGDRALVIRFTGGREVREPEQCAPTYTPLVSESDKEVVVALRTHTLQRRSPVGCDAIGYERSLRVSLVDPLGGRIVRDGFTGTTHPVVGRP